MSQRVATIIVLAEDQEQQILVRRYLERAGHKGRIRDVALPVGRGCGSQYVRERFVEQVEACRTILGRRTKCLLIVMTDADRESCADRERSLHAELKRVDSAAISAEEPIVILIPKWQVETWIKSLLGENIDEDDKTSDRPPVTATQIRAAASVLFDWSRPNARVGPTCPPSLNIALPRWRRTDPL